VEILFKETPCTCETEEEMENIFTESAQAKMILLLVVDNSFSIFLDGL
jgi:hypothetical protein